MANIAVVGLGKLGYPLAAFWMSRGHQVFGVDTHPDILAAIQNIKNWEPGVEELENFSVLNDGKLTLTDAVTAVSQSEFTFIVVPTPTETLTGRFSMEYVLKAAEDIGKGLARCQRFHVVVLVSTVMPGDTEALLIPALEKHSGKKCGQDFGVCYNPEFVALGEVVKGMTKPDFTLIGASDAKAGVRLMEMMHYAGSDHPKHITNIIDAEIAKLSLNCYVTMKISFANQLAEICEATPGANSDVIASAIGCDTRIGHRYLKAGMGFGGPCFPRDNRAFQVFAQQHGQQAILSKAVEVINDRQTPRIAALVAQKYRQHSLAGACQTYVAVLGLSYKPGTPILEESQSILLVDWLVQSGIPCRIHDPLVKAEDLSERLAKWNWVEKLVEYDGYLEQVVRGASVVVLMLPLRAYDTEGLKPEWFGQTRKPFVDCWRFRPDLAVVTDYIGIGIGKRENHA